MTVTTTNNRITYTGDGSTTAFPFPYLFLANTDIQVYVGTVKQTTGFTVTGAGDSSGGTVTFTTAPAAAASIVLYRDPDTLQSTALPANGPFPAKSVETAVDKAMLGLQRVRELLARAFTLPDNDTSGASTVLPSPVASQVIGWNDAGTGLQNFGPVDNTLLSASLAASSGAGLVGTKGTLVGTSSRTQIDKNNDRLDARDFGIIADGTTDQTSALTTIFTNNATFRGTFIIPYNTKFDALTVYAALPVGYILRDESSINTGQPPGYKNKAIRIVTNDLAADDFTQEVVSSHHAAMRLNNLGTAGTDSGNKHFASLIRSAGYRWNHDSIDGMQLLTSKSSRGNLWRTADILNTPYNYAVNGKSEWTAATVYAANAIVNTDDGNVYQTAAGGTSGSTKPTVTSGSVSDGGVTWTYLGPWSAGSTRFYWDEDGYGGISGSASGRWGAESATKQGCSINVIDSTGEVYVADDHTDAKLISRIDAYGVRVAPNAVQSLPYGGILSGATPSLSTSFHAVAQSGSTTITNFVLPGSQEDGYVVLIFTDALSTISHSGSFNLKGNVDATPPSGGVMTFVKRSALSSAWFEISRSF